jgi:hypothetical protein
MAKNMKNDSGVTTNARVYKDDADRLTMLAAAEGKTVAQLVFELCDVQLTARLKIAAPELEKAKRLKSELEALETKAREKIQGQGRGER